MGSRWRQFQPGPVTAAIALGLGYYLGAQLGFILRFPFTTPSVLWPPNAILMGALLLTPPRRWWVFLLAVAPAHLVAEVGTFPMPLVLSLYVTNCLEALIGASIVHAFSDAPARFDSLRRINVFIVGAVLVAPLVSSFLDAWAVNTVLDEPYWSVWRIRLLSNMLTELTVVPALVLAINPRSSPLHGASRALRAKAVSLVVGLLVVGGLVFLGPSQYLEAFPGAPVTPLAFLIPFIILAAVIFGPGGASAALLTTTLLAVLAATYHRGPFSDLPPSEGVSALQISLIIVAVPVISLAALIEERRDAQNALAERLGFEELVSRFSSAFVHLPAHAMDAALETWLGRLGRFFGLDRLVLFRLTDDGHDLVPACGWPPSPRSIPARFSVRGELPWVFARLMREEAVAVSRVRELPEEAEIDAATFRRHGVVSNVTIPLGVGATLAGALSFDSIRAEREWPEDQVKSLWLVADVFAGALARRKAEDALRASEVMKSSILASLSSSVVVLDRQGRVIAVNESWRRFARERMTWNTGIDTGNNYLDVCRAEASRGNQPAIEAAAGIEAVLERAQPASSFEYVAGAPGKERWFAVSVVPLNRPEGGAVLSQTDVTERKFAELEAQRSRGELAHFTRVSTMGELAASLAHELNQPLAGILMSAQAARRFLAMTPPDLSELHEALADIIDDDKRAAEVIQRMRELLSKGEFRRDALNLNALIESMAKLLSSDAVMRDLTIRLELDPDLPPVRGDRVQLQQVILNLVLNAMEAMNEAGVTRRPVIVHTRSTGGGMVCVSVTDEGSGLRSGMGDMVFEPFYTTKTSGMGMGLAIARSIVRAHGGAIQASNNDTRGATFVFTLPVGTEAA
jgi:signal transduction histidine kinase/integral membrane sensor domain MASE1